MKDYQKGYEYYKNACTKHGIKPLNFHYYMLTLSEEQLAHYNEQALKKISTAT